MPLRPPRWCFVLNSLGVVGVRHRRIVPVGVIAVSATIGVFVGVFVGVFDGVFVGVSVGVIFVSDTVFVGVYVGVFVSNRGCFRLRDYKWLFVGVVIVCMGCCGRV